VANCNICNKEIQEGYICVDCARSQRQQAGQTTSPKVPAAPQPPRIPTGGFSLNNLKSSVGSPTQPRVIPPTGAPTPPVPNTQTTLPKPFIATTRAQNTPEVPSESDSFSLSEQNKAPAEKDNPELSAPLNAEQLDAFPDAAKNIPHTQIRPPISTSGIPKTESVSPPPFGRRPALNVEKTVTIQKPASEEQAQINKQVYSSEVTGYGDEELEIAKKVLGYVGAGLVVFRIIRFLVWK